MSLYELPDAKPATLLIGDVSGEPTLDFAALLAEHKANFMLLVGEPDLVPASLKDRVITEFDRIPVNVELIIDMNWLHGLSTLTQDILDERSENNSPVVLTVSADKTATEARELYEDFSIIGFNGLPGLFPQLRSVELAPALGTDEKAISLARRFFKHLDFSCEVVADRPGYVLPRILSMIINEAAFSVMEGVADPADIDTAMRLGTNYPRGPLEWADAIGLDVVLAVLNGLHREYGQERYRPCTLLRQMERAGRTGKETGQGFYHYDDDGNRVDV